MKCNTTIFQRIFGGELPQVDHKQKAESKEMGKEKTFGTIGMI